MTEKPTFTPTPAASWSSKPAMEVTLPSGNQAVIRDPNLYILRRAGQVPRKVKQAKARSEEIAEKVSSGKRPTDEELVDINGALELMIAWVCTRAFVDPRVTMSPEPDAVHISAVSGEDRAFVIETLEIEV